MEKVTVKFRGVRGSYPTPKNNFLAYGGNTSCVQINIGERLIVLDAGTGIIDLGKELVQETILNEDKKPISLVLLLSHIHQDHIQGFPFFTPAYLPRTKLGIYGLPLGKKSLKENLSAVLFNKTFPLGLEDMNCDIDIQDFKEKNILIIRKNGEQIFLDVNGYQKFNKNDEDIIITAHKSFAHPKDGCLCFKISYKDKSIVYATDKETYVGSDKKFIDFSRGTDLLIHDSQYTNQEYTSAISPKQGFGHSTFQMAFETFKLAKAKNLACFHFDPNYNDELLQMIESEFTKNNEHIFFAKEGLEFII